MTMTTPNRKTMRVAFQGEPGAFSEAAAIQLLGESITTVPRATFEGMFRSIEEGTADAILAPVENSLAGSVVRVFDLLLESRLAIVAETILPIEMQLIALPGASVDDIRSVASHPMALAQCERFFAAHPKWKRVPAEDTAGSVREVISAGDKSRAAIAGRRAAEHYRAEILPNESRTMSKISRASSFSCRKRKPLRGSPTKRARLPWLCGSLIARARCLRLLNLSQSTGLIYSRSKAARFTAAPGSINSLLMWRQRTPRTSTTRSPKSAKPPANSASSAATKPPRARTKGSTKPS